MKTWLSALRMILVWTLLLGGAYPLVVTVAGWWLFPQKIEGKLIRKGEKIVGSELLAQKFTSEKYFWPRPSAADYATVASGASNQGATSQTLKTAMDERTQLLIKSHGEQSPVPVELITASGSGLDPHLSPESVKYQAMRVAGARNLPLQVVEKLIDHCTQPPQYKLFGKPMVNVLLLNLALDEIASPAS